MDLLMAFSNDILRPVQGCAPVLQVPTSHPHPDTLSSVRDIVEPVFVHESGD